MNYSNQKQLDQLEAKLLELLNPNVADVPLTAKEIDQGIYDIEARVTATRKAIEAHEELKEAEYTAFKKAEEAKLSLELKQTAYKKSVEYVEALKKAQEIALSVEGGAGYRPYDHFPTSALGHKHEMEVVIRKAEKGLHALDQYKV